MAELAIKIENLRKQYRLGTIGGNTLNAELQSWWARKRGKEDPNLKIGENHTKTGGQFWALDGIGLEVGKGEALGIIGANGAGKSTLLKILSRVTAPTEGDIWVNGRISSMLEVGTGFHGELTGRENIYMNGAILGMSKKEVDAKMDSIIEFSECGQFIDTPVKRYSSGMYVKLAFAVASHLDSEIMVMDEVLAVGDMKFQRKCLGKMGDASQNEGRTVLYVSHNMATIRNLCTRCIVLNKGKIIYNGNPEEAIAFYLEETQDNFLTKYDCKNLVRNNFQLGKKVRIDSFEFIGKQSAQFDIAEKLHFKIIWRALADIDELRVRFAVKYIDSTNIGLAESGAFTSARQGQEYNNEFECDLSNLVPGTYYLKLFLFVIDSLGGYYDLDAAMANIYFEIIDTNSKNPMWKQPYWGNVRLNPIIKK